MEKEDLKIVFMGTPDFSATVLKALSASGFNVILSVSQPDKPVGRKHVITPPPAKVAAEELGIEVFQPDSMRSDEAFEKLSSVAPDLVVTAAYGKILPERVLNIPRYGCINVHASLLPRYRGASPVHNAILNGDEVTGVTIMKMDAGMDTGDMIASVEVPVDPDIHTDDLMAELAVAGSELLTDIIEDYVSGDIEAVPQDSSLATSCPMIRPEQAEFSWDMKGLDIHNKVRALSTWPGAYTFVDGKKFKVLDSRFLGDVPEAEGFTEPGTVVKAKKGDLFVLTGEGVLKLLVIQYEGGKKLSAQDCAHNFTVGSVLK
ncbi:MAG TPA: methionyl-tRNA formyltransferase [Clostridiales bacterium]|nr:methionyl-tRNA formyltransferase [Clostridiales bacterium]